MENNTEKETAINTDGAEQYDEAFKERAAAIAHARSRSLSETAASLSVPPELLAAWKTKYADKIEVLYLDDRHVKGRSGGLPYLPKREKTDVSKMERCPKCGASVVFEPVKQYEVGRKGGVDIGTHDSVMDSGDDGILGFKVPYVRVTTEVIARCPACGLYTIGNIIEKLTNSEA